MVGDSSNSVMVVNIAAKLSARFISCSILPSVNCWLLLSFVVLHHSGTKDAFFQRSMQEALVIDFFTPSVIFLLMSPIPEFIMLIDMRLIWGGL